MFISWIHLAPTEGPAIFSTKKPEFVGPFIYQATIFLEASDDD